MQNKKVQDGLTSFGGLIPAERLVKRGFFSPISPFLPTKNKGEKLMDASKNNFKTKPKPSRFKRGKLKLIVTPKTDKTPKRRRATRNKPRYIKPVHAIPNEIAVPSPFGIYHRHDELGYHKTPLTIVDGKTEIQVSGQKLNIKDSSVFICLSQQVIEQNNLDIMTSLAELCGRLSTGKPSYTSKTKEVIRRSLIRLYNAEIKITYFEDYKKKNNWGRL